jgi:hypothetical protein
MAESTSFHSNEYVTFFVTVTFFRYGLILFVPSYNNVFNIKTAQCQIPEHHNHNAEEVLVASCAVV